MIDGKLAHWYPLPGDGGLQYEPQPEFMDTLGREALGVPEEQE